MFKSVMFKSAIVFTIASFFLVSIFASAEEEPGFKGDFELGWLTTAGNTDTVSTKAKVKVDHNTKYLRNNYILEGYSSSSDVRVPSADDPNILNTVNQTTAEKYFASMRNEFKLNKKHSAMFLFSSYEDDRFSGFDYQASIAAGYANRLFQYDRSHFDYRIGPGYSVAKEITVDNNDVIIAEETIETAIVRVDLEYVFNITENAKFEQNVASEIATDSEKNTKTKSISAISANINKSLALKAAFTINYNDVVPAGKKQADTQSSFTLVYSF